MATTARRIANAFVNQGSISLAGKCLNLVVMISMARLLTPRDFGLVTVALLVLGVANLSSHFGFQSYVIQAKSLDARSIDVCYTLNVGVSAVVGGLVAAAGWALADSETLRAMLVLYGLFVFVGGLSYLDLALLKRDLKFEQSARLELYYTAFSGVGRVGLAVMGFGAVSFALGDLLGEVSRWILVRRSRTRTLRVVNPWVSDGRDALRFGAYATLIGAAGFLANQADKLLLSISQPLSAVGLYGFASNISSMLYRSLVVPQTTVFLASFARLRDEASEVRKLLSVSSRVIFSLSLPVCVLLVLDSERIVHTIFGETWREAAPLVRIFAAGYLLRSTVSGISGIQLAFGLAASAARTKWINAAVYVLFLSVASVAGLGINGYAIAYVLADLVVAVHNVFVNGRVIDLAWGPYLANLAGPAAIASGSSLVWGVTRHSVVVGPEWANVVLSSAVWLSVYLALSVRFNSGVVELVRRQIINVMARRTSPRGNASR